MSGSGNPLADFLGMNSVEAARVFGKGPPAVDVEPEGEPVTVMLRFGTPEQRRKAADRILATGRLKVRIRREDIE